MCEFYFFSPRVGIGSKPSGREKKKKNIAASWEGVTAGRVYYRPGKRKGRVPACGATSVCAGRARDATVHADGLSDDGTPRRRRTSVQRPSSSRGRILRVSFFSRGIRLFFLGFAGWSSGDQENTHISHTPKKK